MIKRIQRMLVKEFLQMLRDPRMRMVVFGMPVFQMMIMAFALTMDVMDIPTAVMDMDQTTASRELIQAFTAGGYFRIDHMLYAQHEIDDLMDQGRIEAAIYIPSGFAKRMQNNQTARFQLITNGTNSNTTAIVNGYAEGIVNTYAAQKNRQHLARSLGRHHPLVQIETAARIWFNPNQESKYYYVPSLIAVMLFLFSLLLTSIGIVKEKEIGTIEQVMVTPIKKIEFILGKTLPYMITGYITMTLMLIVAMVVFGIRVKGNVFLLYGLTGIYLFGNVGLALLVSASAVTQQQALLTSFLIIMPCVMLSGFMFPIKNMPETVQYATYLNPMRWYLEILRGIIMKGVGFKTLWPAVCSQAALAVVFIGLSSKRFRKTLS